VPKTDVSLGEFFIDIGFVVIEVHPKARLIATVDLGTSAPQTSLQHHETPPWR
jgi:hypothetical protein